VRERTADYQRAAAEADAANAAKSSFLATMSHEIRTSMNGVLVMAELLAEGRLADAERHKAQMIVRSGRNLLAIINDILDFPKIEAGKLDIVPGPHDPGETIAAVHALHGDAARGKGLAFTCENALEPGRGVMADPVRLGQVVSNLVSNAIKFTGEGTVGIRVAPLPDDAQRVCFTVRDSGIGILPDKQDAIFEVFTRADQTTHRSYGGTGLGLSIARHLVEGMGGVMELESVEGEGTCFRFTLPGCAILTSGQETAVAQIAQPDLSAARVLVADDSETNLAVGRAAFGRFGLAPDCLRDGHEAVAALDGAGYDLVLMDGWMPGLDGYAATREIRAREARQARAGFDRGAHRACGRCAGAGLARGGYGCGIVETLHAFAIAGDPDAPSAG